MDIYDTYCNKTYGINSSNASMLDTNCFNNAEIDYTINASTVKKILSSSCSNTYDVIYNNYSDECSQASLPDIVGKFEYIQNIRTISYMIYHLS